MTNAPAGIRIMPCSRGIRGTGIEADGRESMRLLRGKIPKNKATARRKSTANL
jgi:hypothetical protein